MLNLVLGVLILTCFSLQAVTTEVVAVHQALSFHSTDQLGDSGILKEPVQADVMVVPMALSGAFPEVLVAAVAKPHQLQAIGNYAEKEANLVVLCGIRLNCEAVPDEDRIQITVDVANLSLPEEVETGPRQTVQLVVAAIQRTFDNWGTVLPEKLKVTVSVTGAKKHQAFLKELSTFFVVGGRD